MTSHPSTSAKPDTGPDNPAPASARTREQDLYYSLPPLVPVATASEVLGLPLSSVYRYATTGGLEAKRLGRRIFILKVGIRAWLDRDTTPAQPAPASPSGDQRQESAA